MSSRTWQRTFTRDGRTWLVEIRTLAGPVTQPECVGIAVHGWEPLGPVRATDIRSIPLGDMIRDAQAEHVRRERRTQLAQLVKLKPEERVALRQARGRKRGRRVRWDRDAILRIVRQADIDQDSSIDAVSREFGVEYWAAAKAIERYGVREQLEQEARASRAEEQRIARERAKSASPRRRVTPWEQPTPRKKVCRQQIDHRTRRGKQ